MTDLVHGPALPHAFEVMKIVEGAVGADRAKVVAYTEMLAKKLEADGDRALADRIRKVLRSAKSTLLSPAEMAVGRLPVDGESRLALADEETLAPEDASVVLAPQAQADLERFVAYVRHADRLIQNGVGVSPAMLLHGPPGCGKTEAARHVAAQLHLPLITARTDALISSFLGSTAKNIRMLFEHTSRRPCVLFLDEFDAIAKLRDDRHELGELKRVVVSLLQNIDSVSGKTVLLAATNHPHLLDSAVWRRFAVHVEIGLPPEHVRVSLFQRFLGHFATDEQTRLYARVSDGLSGADIRRLADDAKRSAVLSSAAEVTEEDVLWLIIRARVPDITKDRDGLPAKLERVKALSPKIFTTRRLAKVFDCSVGYVSKNIRMGDHGG